MKLGMFLILIGLAFVFIGLLFSAHNIDFGGFIMIGPIPIAFGTSPMLTVIAMIIALLLMLVYFMLWRRNV